jgi:putative lipoic acid-binding regulatory protein
VGTDQDDFAEFAADVVRRIVDDPDTVSYRTRPSRNGSYLAVTISFIATDQQQLDKVFEQMSAQERVVWVL